MLAQHEDLNGKVRLCLMDARRDLTYLLRNAVVEEDRLSKTHAQRLRNLIGDIDALLPHNNFLFEKVNFLLQGAQGFINIEQNQIIKIFSVAAVALMPPTLIASIYGMNFHVMPELSWDVRLPARNRRDDRFGDAAVPLLQTPRVVVGKAGVRALLFGVAPRLIELLSALTPSEHSDPFLFDADRVAASFDPARRVAG